MTRSPDASRVVVIGAGAAGLATAAFTRQLNPDIDVLLLDGAARPGAKILVSGGSRCNVTNARVTERDFWGGRPAFIRQVLRAFTVEQTVAFFAGLGVPLHEEEHGKLFPDSNRSRDVLNALLHACADSGVDLRAGHRATAIMRDDAGFLVRTPCGVFAAPRVVLATGGCALPKSGSDGAGYGFAASLGHTIVPPTPALAPLVLAEAAPSLHRRATGVSHEAELTVWIDGKAFVRLRGALLWTHFGISGPVALNASRHWARARLEGREVRLTVSFCPGRTFDEVDREVRDAARARPRAAIPTLLADLPGSIAAALTGSCGIATDVVGAQLTREDRRRLAHALTAWPAPVENTRGYTFAEATAGGVRVDEIDARTMESRICRGLFLVGEVIDVDGRLGEFNFQWAWASARSAARALARPYPQLT